MNKSINKPMNKAEVKKSLRTLNRGSIAIREGLAFMKMRKAHEAYDFSSFKEFLVKKVAPEIDYSYDSCNDQANAGEIEYNVGGKEFIGTNSYSALEPLIRAKLEPAEQKEVFQHLAEENELESICDIDKNDITNKLMTEVLTELGYTDSQETKQKDKSKNQNSNSNSDSDGDGDSASESKGESNSSRSGEELIESFSSALICWSRNHECIDDTIFFDFLEVVTESLCQDTEEIEDVICGAVVKSFCTIDKEHFSKLILESLPRRNVKKLIKQINH